MMQELLKYQQKRNRKTNRKLFKGCEKVIGKKDFK